MIDELDVDLKPCPFCGGNAYIDDYDRSYIAICWNCHAETYEFKDKEECIRAWNNRPIEDEKDKEIESLKVELDNLRHFCDSILEMAKLNNGVLYFKQDSGIWKIETGKDNCSYRRLV